MHGSRAELDVTFVPFRFVTDLLLIIFTKRRFRHDAVDLYDSILQWWITLDI